MLCTRGFESHPRRIIFLLLETLHYFLSSKYHINGKLLLLLFYLSSSVISCLSGGFSNLTTTNAFVPLLSTIGKIRFYCIGLFWSFNNNKLKKCQSRKLDFSSASESVASWRWGWFYKYAAACKNLISKQLWPYTAVPKLLWPFVITCLTISFETLLNTLAKTSNLWYYSRNSAYLQNTVRWQHLSKMKKIGRFKWVKKISFLPKRNRLHPRRVLPPTCW